MNEAQSEYEATMISQIPKLEHGKVLLGRIERELEREREDLETQPQVNNENMKRDFRFKLGRIDALKWVRSRPDEAQDLLNLLDRRE